MAKQDYYLGLDLGTSSVGWAVTDEKYKLQRFNKKDMWGSRIFDEAQTASVRRVNRSSRRRNQRQKKRIEILQELFADEMQKIDPTFFLRLKESKFHFSDKKVPEKYILFNDKKFYDKDYYKLYPTIYHLRSDLINDEGKKDLRLVYLGLHHILKYRGHFLFEGQDFTINEAFESIFSKLSNYLSEKFQFNIPLEIYKDIKNIILDKNLTLRDKVQNLAVACDTNNPQYKNILSVMIGGKRKLSVLFNNPEYDNAEKRDIDFRVSSFNEEREVYEQILNEDILLLDYLKSVYDWMILSEILKSNTYFSEAQVDVYQQHSEDLKDLKYLIKNYGKKGDMKECFNDPKVERNYVSYIKSTLANGRHKAKKICNQEETNKFFMEKVKNFQVSDKDKEIYLRIISRLEEKIALPKLRNTDNSVIPYQIHKQELDKILYNASKHYDFLNRVDETGFSISEKIKKTMTFKIPYYIGPLNTFHSEYNGGHGNAWMVKKLNIPITPWNFESVVDEEKSSERFIRRMTNKCTYIFGADVIPEQSLLYEKFKVLNELNNLKLNGKPITVELKHKIFIELFQNYKKVTQKILCSYLKKIGYFYGENIVISGIDGDFKSSLNSYLFFKEMLGENINFEPYNSMVEKIIFWKSIFDSGGKLVRKKIKENYGEYFNDRQISDISNINFKGWGRFSTELLTGISGISYETGEQFTSIIDALEKTNDNLMELLSSKYTFKEGIEKYNDVEETFDKISYENIMKDVYLSPAVKRTVWQAITICEEIKKIRKAPPKRIFIEMTRNPDSKKERKDSRRDDLIKLYKACKDDVSKFIKELESYEDRNLRAKALYLYYTQKGKCMYTGESIDLSFILNKKDSVASLYDIDHIYPRSITKDDSLDNLVLVKKNINIELSDTYPLDISIQNKMFSFWKELKEQGFISSNKFYRLIRKDALTIEELAGFINRQLVETSQAAKTTADILKKLYPSTEIIYTKAKVVNDFRQKFDLLKCRELNNFHHAHDAYLNIIAGNSYHTKFTTNPYNYIKTQKDKGRQRFYNLEKFFEKRVGKGGYIAWDKEVHLPFVIKTLERPTVNVVRMPITQKGELFDATLERKTNEQKLLAPIKGSDERYKDFSKYGGYKKLKGAYFFAVEHTVKNKRIRTLEQLYLIYIDKVNTIKDLERYCIDILGLIDPKIIHSKIKFGSKLFWDGFPLYIQSRSGNSIWFSVAKEIVLDKKSTEIYRKLVKEARGMEGKKEVKILIPDVELVSLYDEYLKLLKEGEYKERPNNPKKIIEEGRERFIHLTSKEKISVLLEIHKVFGRESLSGVNLKLIGGKSKSAVATKGKDFSKSNVIIINESPTGLYKNYKVLN